MARVKEKNKAAPLPTAKSKQIFFTKSKNFVLQLTYPANTRLLGSWQTSDMNKTLSDYRNNVPEESWAKNWTFQWDLYLQNLLPCHLMRGRSTYRVSWPATILHHIDISATFIMWIQEVQSIILLSQKLGLVTSTLRAELIILYIYHIIITLVCGLI